jgi:hypothetical protein
MYSIVKAMSVFTVSKLLNHEQAIDIYGANPPPYSSVQLWWSEQRPTANFNGMKGGEKKKKENTCVDELSAKTFYVVMSFQQKLLML